MAENLTKTALKTELRRRIDWYERSYPEINQLNRFNFEKESPLMLEAYGRYRAYQNMWEQVEWGHFLGGGL